MWAGGRVHFHAPLPVGAPAIRHSRILSVEEKEGRSGALVLVTVEHRIVHEGVAAVVEEQDLIYREAPTGGGGAPAQGSPVQGSPAQGSPAQGSDEGEGGAPVSVPAGWDWQDRTSTDPVLLFRFSALTFNGHRIHYDHPYTTRVEGYPGLVVHGPLSALLLMRSGCAHISEPPASFRYRGVSPLFCGDPIALVGRREEPEESGAPPATALELRGPRGGATMEGRISWQPPPSARRPVHPSPPPPTRAHP
jgi:3-methylfumaryl-CoA hydratase